MVEALVISNLVLWAIVLVLALLLFALARQVGILHERVAPAGAATHSGPKVGELTTAMQLTALDGASHQIGGATEDGLAVLLLFISPGCPVCKALAPTACSLVKSERQRMRLLFASDGDKPEQHKQYVRDLGIEAYPYFISQALGLAYQVSKLPFAVLVGADGILYGKGLVNTREHLESLIESMDSGVATVQEYISSRQEPEYSPSVVEQSS